MKDRNIGLSALSRQRALAVVAGCILTAPAVSADFSLGDNNDVTGSFNATISAGAAWRMEGRDSALYAPANGSQHGLPTGRGANADDGDLNYGKGDLYSSFLKLVADLELKKDNYGGFVRFKAWYDNTLKNGDVVHGNEANNYAAGHPLSDTGLDPLQKFDNVYLLDAYAYGNWRTDGGSSVNLRVGRQALNWGESLFIQGVNVISPLDVPAFRRPGTEVKEALLPVGMVYVNWGIPRGPSIEAFYEFQWQPTTIDACGTYFSTVDVAIGAHAASSGCSGGVVAAPDPHGWNASLYVPLTDSKTPSNGGQGGLAVHYLVDALDTELGAYALDIHSRTPVLNGVRGAVPFEAQAPLGPVVKAFWQYPEHIHMYGLSAATTLAGVSVGAELSYTPNYPTQISTGDIVAALLYGPAGRIPSQFWGPMGPAVLATPVGGEVQGWSNTHKTQFQVNGIQVFSNVLGAQNLTLAGEVGASWASDFLPDLRYGRGFVFGIAQDPSYGPLNNAVAGHCPPLNSPNQPGCENGGFMSHFAWGYRLRGQLDYFNFMNSGMTLSPNVAWAQDVSGVSVDNQFNGGRQVLGTGVNLAYQKKYTFGVQYVWYNGNAKWDPLRDRNYLAINASVTF